MCRSRGHFVVALSWLVLAAGVSGCSREVAGPMPNAGNGSEVEELPAPSPRTEPAAADDAPSPAQESNPAPNEASVAARTNATPDPGQTATSASADPTPAPPPQEDMHDINLIPRAVLFGNPQRTDADISPDGTKLSFRAPVDGVLNVWVGPIDDPTAAKPVTKDTKRGIRTYFWAFTSRHILYLQDQNGDEDWHVYCVDLATGETKDLTPLEKVAAQIEGVSERFPEEVLVGLNNRDPRYHDVYRVNITTGERTLVQENPGLLGFLTDDDYRVRFGLSAGPDGMKLLKPNDAQGWDDYLSIPMEDSMTSSPAGFDKSGKTLYFVESRDRDTGAFTAIDLETNKQTVIAEDPHADFSGVMMQPVEKTVQAVAFNYLRREWKVLDPTVKADLDFLATVRAGEIDVVSRTLDDGQWIVAFSTDDGPVHYYRYQRAEKKADYLFANRDDLEGLPLVPMHPLVIPSRDGLNLVSYLSLPPGTDDDGDGRPSRAVPMVLNVHGGPWARDSWGFDPEAQLLANRGYAVLNVNFRGSTGFGKKFVHASAREWAGKMHDDLIDAVNWAIAEKIADPQRVAIMGGSYGGYATLVGLTFTPETFACGVDIVGPSNLQTLLKSTPEYWAAFLPIMTELMGDPETAEGRALLDARSPLSFVDRIQRPLLIGQGKNDPRVKQAESDQIVAAMQSKHIPVTYVLFPDEGHGFARPENRLSFYAVAEAFLAEHLGGRYEPIGGAFQGASITVPTGADDVPGLAEALSAAQ